MFLSSWVLPDDICNEILVLKVDATETEAYLAPCHKLKGLIFSTISPLDIFFYSFFFKAHLFLAQAVRAYPNACFQPQMCFTRLHFFLLGCIL